MKCTKEEFEIIVKICERAENLGIEQKDRLTLIMDIENTHVSMGLNLKGLLESDDLNFSHDVVGIQTHINRDTKELDDFFVPRYAIQKDFDINKVIDKAKAVAEKGENAKVSTDKEIAD